MHLTKYDGGREDNGQRMRPYGVGEIAESLGSSTPLTEHSHSPVVMIPLVCSFFHEPLLLIVGFVSYLYGLGQNKS